MCSQLPTSFLFKPFKVQQKLSFVDSLYIDSGYDLVAR